MAVYESIEELKNMVNDTIYQNNAGLVTAAVLQERLIDILDTLNSLKVNTADYDDTDVLDKVKNAGGANQLFAGVTALIDASTIAWDMLGDGYNASVTLGGNRTLAITHVAAGMCGTLKVKQPSGGNKTLTLPAGSKVLGGSLALSTAGNAIDILSFFYDGTDFFWTIGKNFS